MSIYFALASNGLMKIGFSENPRVRMHGLRGECGGRTVRLKAVIDGTLAEERGWHMRFGHLYHHGEWFHYRGRLKRFVEARSHTVPKRKRRKGYKVFKNISPEALPEMLRDRKFVRLRNGSYMLYNRKQR